MGIAFPIGPKKLCGCRLTRSPTKDAMWWIFKLVLAPLSTMAEQGKSSTSHITNLPVLRLKTPVAKTFDSTVFSASNESSFLFGILRDPRLELMVSVFLKRGFRAKRLTGVLFWEKRYLGQNICSFGWKWSYQRTSIENSGRSSSLNSATYPCSLHALDH